MATTMLEHVLNLQVLADMIGAELEYELRARDFFRVDRTLQGRPGDTITVPTWVYIGPAEDVPEAAPIPISQLEFEDVSYTIKKAGKGIKLTDEALLSGYGRPMDESARQLRMSIADKMDNDGHELLNAITPSTGLVYDHSGVINFEAIVNGLDLFRLESQGTNLYLLVSSDAITTLRKDPQFVYRDTNAADGIIATGVVGRVAGCQVVISNKLPADRAYILKPQALTAFYKRDVLVETDRDIIHAINHIVVNCHYMVAIEHYDRIIQIRLGS